MKLLLDTHIFLWLNQEPEKLPAHILSLCEDVSHTLFLSQVSVWEIQIKHQLGKLKLDVPLSLSLSLCLCLSLSLSYICSRFCFDFL